MFNKGDRIHMHDGTVITARRKGIPKKVAQHVARSNRGMEFPSIRGFVRGAIVDCVTGEEQRGDWHENVITVAGHQQVIKNFAGLAGSSHASFLAVGNHTSGASTDYSTVTAMQSEYPMNSNSSYNAAGSRATLSAQQQALGGTWSLNQSFSYASVNITSNATINAVGQCYISSVGGGSLLSLAVFNSSTKGSNQALNITYNWLFST